MATPTSTPTLWTLPQLADYLQLHPETVRDWVARGEVPHLRISPDGRRPTIRFRARDVEEWLEGMTSPGSMSHGR